MAKLHRRRYSSVSQLPSVAVRVALDHSLVDDLGRGFDPDDGQRRALGGQLGLQVCDKGVVAHLLGERRVDQDNIVVVQCSMARARTQSYS